MLTNLLVIFVPLLIAILYIVYKVFRGRKYGGEPLPVVIDDVEAQISEAAEDAMEWLRLCGSSEGVSF
jgi:hypothetical protein